MISRAYAFGALALLAVAVALTANACGGDSGAPDAAPVAGSGGMAGGGSSGSAAGGGATGKGGSGSVAAGGPAGGGTGTGAGAGAGGGGSAGVSNTGTGGHLTIPAGTLALDCGPGCRAVLQSPIALVRETYTLDGEWIGAVAEWRKSLLAAKLGDPTTYVVGNYSGTPLGNLGLSNATLRGDFQAAMFYSKTTKKMDLRILNRLTGEERKLADVGNAVTWEGLVMTDDYVIGSIGNLYRFDRTTGEQVLVGPYARCLFPQMLGRRYTCTSSDAMRYLQWDIDNPGDPTELAPTPTPTLQEDGRCTSDGSHCAWIDYRDPPGPMSNYDNRRGGELYVKDMQTGAVERLTYDSPNATRPKMTAAANAELAVWQEFPKVTVGSISYDFLLSETETLAKLDRKTQQRCRYEKFRSGSYHLLGRKLLATWGSPTDPNGYHYVVEVDLDSPDIPWVCEKNVTP